MNIDLPADLEEDLKAEVERGRFASVDAAIIEAIRGLIQRRSWWRRLPGPFTGTIKEHVDSMETVDELVRQGRRGAETKPDTDSPIGSMREFADGRGRDGRGGHEAAAG